MVICIEETRNLVQLDILQIDTHLDKSHVVVDM